MAGLPKDVKWAARRVEEDGRPLRGLTLELLAGGVVPVGEQVRVLGEHVGEGEEVVVRVVDGREEAFIESRGGVPGVHGEGVGVPLEVLRMRERVRRAARRSEEGVAREVRAETTARVLEDTAVLAMVLQEQLVREGLAEGADVAVKRLAASVAEKVIDRVAGKAVQVQETTHHAGDVKGWRGLLAERARPASADEPLLLEGAEVVEEEE